MRAGRNGPPAAQHMRAGRRIGTGFIETLESRVIELRHLDDTVGSRTLLPVIRAELDQAEHLARTASYTDASGKRLYTVIGELA